MTMEQIPNPLLGQSVARANLLVNGGFEWWQRGGGPFTASSIYTADRWVQTLASGDTLSTIPTSGVVGQIPATRNAGQFTYTRSTGGTSVAQTLKATEQPLAGLTLSLSAILYATVVNAIRIYLQSDGTGGATAYSPYHPGDTTWTMVGVTYSVPLNATQLTAGIAFNASGTFYADNMMLVAGTVPTAYVPLLPSEDLARCQRYYERRPEPGSSGEMIFNGYNATASDTNYVYVPFKVTKCVMPTYTLLGTWSVSNVGQPNMTSGQKSSDGVRLDIPATGAGRWYCQNYPGTSQWITAEANP